MLNQASRGWERIVTSASGQENHIEVDRPDVRTLERPLGCLHGQVRAGFARASDTTRPDACPFCDPLIRCGDHFLQIGVGDDLLGDVGARPCNARPHAEGSPAGRLSERLSSMSRWINASTWLSARPFARRIAFLMAFAEERP